MPCDPRRARRRRHRPAEVDALASYTMEETDEVEVARRGLGDLTFFSKSATAAAPAPPSPTSPPPSPPVRPPSASPGGPGRGAPVPGPGGTRPPNSLIPPAQWTRPFGLLRPSDETAMLTRRDITEYGTTRDDLLSPSPSPAATGPTRTPAATMYDRPLTREMYMTSRWISEPLPLRQPPETDGASLSVIVSAERARDCGDHHLAAQGLAPAPRDGHALERRPLTGPALDSRPLEKMPTSLWMMSVCPDLRRCSPPAPPPGGGYGFCGRGEAGAFTEGGRLQDRRPGG